MVVVQISETNVTEPYNTRSDNGFFEVEEGKGAIYVVEYGTFLILPLSVFIKRESSLMELTL